MSNPIAQRRLELSQAFARRQLELPRLEHTRLRFSLGTSLSELKVPYHPSPEAARILSASGRQLALMLVSRHRDLISVDDFDRFLLSDEFGAIPQAPHSLGPGSGGPEVRSSAQLGQKLHPALTGGVLAAWMGPGGGGRSLVALVIEVLKKGFAEMRLARGREETPTLVALMLGSLLPLCERGIREADLPAPAERPLKVAAGIGAYLAIRLGVERALRDSGAASEVAMRIEAALSPGALIGGWPGLQSGGSRLYGADFSGGSPSLDELHSALSSGADGKGLEGALVRRIASDGDLARWAERDAGLEALQERFVHLATLGEGKDVSESLTALAQELATRPQSLTGLLAEEKQRKELAKDLARLAESLPPPAANAVVQLSQALKGFKEKDPAASAGMSRAGAHARYAQACLAAACEGWMEKALLPARRALELRTGKESEGGLEGDYQAGRLYRLGPGEAPLLKSATTASVGHLFVDVKDFTRRTRLLGEATIAEFLRREFYVPILASAKGRFGGMAHLADRGGVTLNNLLGDALSLSGGIEALVGLALEIRRHLGAYERQLVRAVSSEQVARAVAAIEEEYARGGAGLKGGSSAGRAGDKEAALARARGEGLEAGIFISFGPAPLVLNLEDEIFGRQRVAIADRINESARGTARSGGARARADALLEEERTRRGNPKLAHPWSVFVGTPWVVPITPAVEDAARAAFQRGDRQSAILAMAEPFKAALDRVSRTEDSPGDIYNAGAALSEEALLAFQEELGERRTFRQITVRPEDLHPSLRTRYHFAGPEKLMASFHPDGRLAELFRYAGRASFKGQERSGGIGVWELVGEGGVQALLEEHHAPQWFRGPG